MKSIYKLVLIVLLIVYVAFVGGIAARGGGAGQDGEFGVFQPKQLLAVAENVAVGTAALDGKAIIVVVIRGADARNIFDRFKEDQIWFKDAGLLILLDLSMGI